MKGFTPITRSRTRRGMNGNVAEWLTAVEGLPEVHSRLIRVLIENMDANALIKREDTPDTLFYCDPPYLDETRVSKKAYKHEMTKQQHKQLILTLEQCKGKVMLSGYSSVMYNSMLGGWNRHEFKVPNHAAGGKKKREMIEVLWCNF